MTKEERFVVSPLQRFLLDPRRSGAAWAIKHRPRHGKSATGWDLQADRKNQVLLIEAKYISGAFAPAIAGLTLAPLTHRVERMQSGRKEGSWCASVAWAIGWDRSKHQMAGIYQILLDYFSRNLTFWQCYARELKVKCIFFVQQGSVARISFDRMLGLAKQYAATAGRSLPERRERANQLLSALVFK